MNNNETYPEVVDTKSNQQTEINNIKITEALTSLFGVNHEKICKLTKKEAQKLSDQNEVNSDEAQLAQLLGKYDELMALNDKPNTISLSSVLNDAYSVHQLTTA